MCVGVSLWAGGHGCVWVCSGGCAMCMRGCARVCSGVSGCAQVCAGVHGYVLVCAENPSVFLKKVTRLIVIKLRQLIVQIPFEIFKKPPYPGGSDY